MNTLINFRVPKSLLEAFDNACILSEMTRTQLLLELMRTYMRDVGSKLPDMIDDATVIREKLKNAVVSLDMANWAQGSGGVREGIHRPALKRFSSFVG